MYSHPKNTKNIIAPSLTTYSAFLSPARTRAAVADIDYFVTRRVRALQNYVLLNDEAEKLQFQQAGTQVLQRLAVWRKSSVRREANDPDLPAVAAAFDSLSGPSEKIDALMEKGRRTEAMALVESDFVPASVSALKAIADAKKRSEASAIQAEQDMTAELRRKHWSLLAGVGTGVCGNGGQSRIIFFLLDKQGGQTRRGGTLSFPPSSAGGSLAGRVVRPRRASRPGRRTGRIV